MKKVLFTATVAGHILNFHIPYLKYFKEQGYEVHVATNGNKKIPYCDKLYNVCFARSPFKLSNIKALNELKSIIDNNDYKIIHCHTPMGATLTRIASIKSRGKGTKVIYTAHGFHFFKGAPLINCLIYYPIEKLLSRYTDTLITINEEDYNTATNKGFYAKEIVLVNGVGIDLEEFTPTNDKIRNSLKLEYGYKEDDFILTYVGELSYRKHQDLLINLVAKLKDSIPNLKLLLVGDGRLNEQYTNQIKELEVLENVKLLGYRKDVDNIMALSNIAVSSSRQEGLPVNVMEAMATGLPLVVTNCRGNRDLVKDGENGYVVGVDDVEGFANAIEKIYKDNILRKKFGDKSIELIQKYSLENVMEEMKEIYVSQLGGKV